jgi:hypothetical protein
MADANRSSETTPPPDTVRGGERGERAIAAVRSRFRRLGRWAVRFSGESLRAWRYLDFEQRVAGVGALLLIVSTFGPFSFVEGAIVLVGLAVLLLLKKRADGRSFHLPFGDGAVIMAAGAWSGLLIVIRLFDRPLGQNLLALVCAAILALAGLRMRIRRPADDLPAERRPTAAAEAGEVEIDFAPRPARRDTAETEALGGDEQATEALPPDPPPPPRVQRRTPAARRPLPPPPAPAPPTAVRPSAPQSPSERVDPDFDLPDSEPPRLDRQPPPAAEDAADAGPFRARPAKPSEAPPPSERGRRRD